MSELTPADIAAVNGHDGDGFCNGSSAWILIILFAMIFGWGNGGFGYGGNGAAAATAQDIQRAVDLNSIQEGQRALGADIQRTAYENMVVTKDASYNNLSEIRDLQTAINMGFANQQTCCCETQRAIDGVNYNVMAQSAAVQANDTANTQKVLDAIANNRMADMQNQINALQMQNALCGVVRYPMATTYNSGGNPFCGCGGCGNGYNNI